MGYRFVVRNVRMTTGISPYENFQIETAIENVGFGNLIKNEQTSVIIKGNGLEKEFKLWKLDEGKGEKASNYAPQKWLSGSSLTERKTNIMSAELDLPNDMPAGNYKVYIKIANRKNGEGEYPIRFSNAGSNVYDSKLKANFVGSLKISKPYKGDVNNDGKLNSYDLLLLKQRILNLVSDKELDMKNADVNRDGRVNIMDYVELYKICR